MVKSVTITEVVLLHKRFSFYEDIKSFGSDLMYISFCLLFFRLTNMTSTNNTNRKSKRDDPKRSSAPTIVVSANEQQVTKVEYLLKFFFFLFN